MIELWILIFGGALVTLLVWITFRSDSGFELELDNPTILSATFLSNKRFHIFFICFRYWLCSHSSWYDFVWMAASCSSFVVLEDDLNPDLTRKYVHTHTLPHILSNLDYRCVCSWSEIFWNWYIDFFLCILMPTVDLWNSKPKSMIVKVSEPAFGPALNWG